MGLLPRRSPLCLLLVLAAAGCAEPVKPGKPFLTRYAAPLHIAHRGGGDELPEHTLYAYDFAVTHAGTDVLEVDVQRTCDGQLVIAHDEDLGIIGLPAERIDAVTVDFLRTREVPFPAGTEMSATATMPVTDRKLLRVPTLDEIIARYRNCLINIEVKRDQDTQALIDFLRRKEQVEREQEPSGPARFDVARNVCFASFDDLASRKLRQAFPGACHTFATLASACAALPRWLPGPLRNESTNCRDYDLFALPDPSGLLHIGLIRSLHAMGAYVHVWSINDRTRMGELLDLGVDGIMTDRPMLLREVMRQRGLPARDQRADPGGTCSIRALPLAEARTEPAFQRCGGSP